MSYTPIPSFPSGGDIRIGQNPNAANDYAHVKAFIAAFRPYAATASRRLSGLPIKFILALWAEESGWGRNEAQAAAQNWANISYTDPAHPAGNTGYYFSGRSRYCTFQGASGFTNGFVSFFTDRAKPDSAVSQTYRSMLGQLRADPNPSPEALAAYLQQAQYNSSSSFVPLVSSTYRTVAAHYGVA